MDYINNNSNNNIDFDNLNSNNNNNNSNNNNNYNINNSKLFYKIIKNKYLFNLILYYLRSSEKRFKTLEDYLNFKQYERLISIDIYDREILNHISLAPSLKHISIHNCEQQISNKLISQIPDSVTSLECNGKVGGPLPTGIKYLKLYDFNRNIEEGFLPSSVEELMFLGIGFDRSIESLSKLSNLKYLDLGKSFKSYTLVGLPDSLETLRLNNYNSTFNKGDLKNIKTLILSSSLFLYSIEYDSLPSTLTTLELHGGTSKPLSQIALPSSITSLFYNSDIQFTCKTPNSCNYLVNLKVLQFGHVYNHPLHYNQFPENLEQLTLGTNYNHQLNEDSLPKNLLSFTLNLNYNGRIIEPNIFPNSITYLDLNSSLSTHQFQANSLPTSLTCLKLPQQYNHEIPLNCLPVSLKYLYLGLCFNQSIKFSLPPNLIEIYFGDHYNQILEPNSLPPSIELISFSPSSNFNQLFSTNSIPPNTTSIELSHKYNQPINTSILPKSIKQIKFNNRIIYNYSNSIFSSSVIHNPNNNK